MKKFRGKDVESGERVYGWYYVDGDGAEIIMSDGLEYVVEPGSVKQFAGYDIKGNELYEGDKVKDKSGNLYRVKLAIEYEYYLADLDKEYELLV